MSTALSVIFSEKVKFRISSTGQGMYNVLLGLASPFGSLISKSTGAYKHRKDI